MWPLNVIIIHHYPIQVCRIKNELFLVSILISVRDHLVGRWIRTHQHQYETDEKVCVFY